MTACSFRCMHWQAAVIHGMHTAGSAHPLPRLAHLQGKWSGAEHVVCTDSINSRNVCMQQQLCHAAQSLMLCSRKLTRMTVLKMATSSLRGRGVMPYEVSRVKQLLLLSGRGCRLPALLLQPNVRSTCAPCNPVEASPYASQTWDIQVLRTRR